MLYEYGKAVVQERTVPRRLASVAQYLHLEYGQGTEPSWLLANGVAEAAQTGATRRREATWTATRGPITTEYVEPSAGTILGPTPQPVVGFEVDLRESCQGCDPGSLP